MKNYVELVKNSIFLSRNLHKSDVIILQLPNKKFREKKGDEKIDEFFLKKYVLLAY